MKDTVVTLCFEVLGAVVVLAVVVAWFEVQLRRDKARARKRKGQRG
jgi:hypothetical protein